MRQYIVRYTVEGSGAGIVEETVTASSDYSARRLIESKYQGQVVRIWSVSSVN